MHVVKMGVYMAARGDDTQQPAESVDTSVKIHTEFAQPQRLWSSRQHLTNALI